MAKKRKQPAVKRRVPATPRDGEELPLRQEAAPYEGGEEEVSHHPGVPRVMVTWHGGGGEERPGPKVWYGMSFEPGKPTPVEQSPFWHAMRADIDNSRAGDWTYEYVVEPPPPPDPPPPEPEPEPEPEAEAQRGRR